MERICFLYAGETFTWSKIAYALEDKCIFKYNDLEYIVYLYTCLTEYLEGRNDLIELPILIMLYNHYSLLSVFKSKKDRVLHGCINKIFWKYAYILCNSSLPFPEQ